MGGRMMDISKLRLTQPQVERELGLSLTKIRTKTVDIIF
jgi:hypothetical protein